MAQPSLRDKQIAVALLRAARILKGRFKGINPNELVGAAFEKLIKLPRDPTDADLVHYVLVALKRTCIDELRKRKRDNERNQRIAAENLVYIDVYARSTEDDEPQLGPEICEQLLVDLRDHVIAKGDSDAEQFIELVALDPTLISASDICRFRTKRIASELGWDLRRVKNTAKKIRRHASALGSPAIKKGSF